MTRTVSRASRSVPLVLAPSCHAQLVRSATHAAQAVALWFRLLAHATAANAIVCTQHYSWKLQRHYESQWAFRFWASVHDMVCAWVR